MSENNEECLNLNPPLFAWTLLCPQFPAKWKNICNHSNWMSITVQSIFLHVGLLLAASVAYLCQCQVVNLVSTVAQGVFGHTWWMGLGGLVPHKHIIRVSWERCSTCVCHRLHPHMQAHAWSCHWCAPWQHVWAQMGGSLTPLSQSQWKTESLFSFFFFIFFQQMAQLTSVLRVRA